MIKPGVYQHYKGPLYRVLFIAEWGVRDMPEPDIVLATYAEANSDESVSLRVRPRQNGNPGFYGGAGLFDARWSGNSTTIYIGEAVVIYVSLSERGRVSARTVKEFEEYVGVPSPNHTAVNRHAPRFKWVAE